MHEKPFLLKYVTSLNPKLAKSQQLKMEKEESRRHYLNFSEKIKFQEEGQMRSSVNDVTKISAALKCLTTFMKLNFLNSRLNKYNKTWF